MNYELNVELQKEIKQLNYSFDRDTIKDLNYVLIENIGKII